MRTVLEATVRMMDQDKWRYPFSTVYREFYLTAAEFEEINQLNDAINSTRQTEEMRRLYDHFQPNPEMNDTYYIKGESDQTVMP